MSNQPDQQQMIRDRLEQCEIVVGELEDSRVWQIVQEDAKRKKM